MPPDAAKHGHDRSNRRYPSEYEGQHLDHLDTSLHATPTISHHVVHYAEVRGEIGREPLPWHSADSVTCVAVAGFSCDMSRCGACNAVDVAAAERGAILVRVRRLRPSDDRAVACAKC